MPVRSLSFAASSVFGPMLVLLANCGGARTTGAPAADPGSKLSAPDAPENLRPSRGEVLTTKASHPRTPNYDAVAGTACTPGKLIAPEADLSDEVPANTSRTTTRGRRGNRPTGARSSAR